MRRFVAASLIRRKCRGADAATLIPSASSVSDESLATDAATHCRLLNADAQITHICRDLQTGRVMEILRLMMPDGRAVAHITPAPASPSGEFTSTPWEDHLKTIAQGERELVDLTFKAAYTYEITLADGTRTRIWRIGGKLHS